MVYVGEDGITQYNLGVMSLDKEGVSMSIRVPKEIQPMKGWTQRSLQAGIEEYKRLYRKPPPALYGMLIDDNYNAFGRSYIMLQREFPFWSRQRLTEAAVKLTPFGKARMNLGYTRVEVRINTTHGPYLDGYPTYDFEAYFRRP